MRGMRQEIRDNSTFLRYHAIWSANPSSVVFAPLAEMLILHKCYEEAIVVCKKGLEKNPDLVSGRIALARAYVGVSNLKRAKEEVTIILNKYKNHPEALEILKVCNGKLTRNISEESAATAFTEDHDIVIEPSSLDPIEDARWNTVTMAEIFASQGDTSAAKKIYDNILKREPDNSRAKEGLVRLPVRQ